jgi:hypothetical protein
MPVYNRPITANDNKPIPVKTKEEGSGDDPAEAAGAKEPTFVTPPAKTLACPETQFLAFVWMTRTLDVEPGGSIETNEKPKPTASPEADRSKNTGGTVPSTNEFDRTAPLEK